MWEQDWRGVDQSDGMAETSRQSAVSNWQGGDDANVEHPTSNAEHRTKGTAGVHGDCALGAADQRGSQDVRKPQFPRSAGVLSGARVKQPELF